MKSEANETPAGWQRAALEGVPALRRRWTFADFREAMRFANAVAELAERLDHHPELHLGYGHCVVYWSTHDSGGVSARDIEAARQLNTLSATLPGKAEPA